MKRRDARLTALILTVSVVFLGGLVLSAAVGEPAAPRAASAEDARPHAAQIELRFKQGVVMLHAKDHEHAIAAFHQVLKYAPDMPEAHVNMGFALVGLGHHAQARDFFESATALRPAQANAYYGMAMALEGLGDTRGAIGAMRAYVHLAPATDRHRRKAEAALWEWEGATGAEPVRLPRK